MGGLYQSCDLICDIIKRSMNIFTQTNEERYEYEIIIP